MPRPKRADQYRDTTIRVTPDVDAAVCTIRGQSHIAGMPQCASYSDAISMAVIRVSEEIMDIIRGIDGAGKK
jgi:hypothetical protein